jgi:hypothetical protein
LLVDSIKTYRAANPGERVELSDVTAEQGTYERTDSAHTVHLDRPDEFILHVKSFFLETRSG